MGAEQEKEGLSFSSASVWACGAERQIAGGLFFPPFFGCYRPLEQLANGDNNKKKKTVGRVHGGCERTDAPLKGNKETKEEARK